jgi:uncharacterized repeat protein (TIGR01451 family)
MWRRAAALIVVAVLAALTATAMATHGSNDLDGKTTVDHTLVPRTKPAGNAYTNLTTGAGEPYIVRASAAAQPGRSERRRSLAYFSQLTDFQLADEESPARVEFLDPGPASAWRPQEGFTPFQIEQTIRQINHFAPASPVPQGDGTRNSMDFGLLTGDQADNQHLNETVWVRDLLEGNGPLNFNGGLSRPEDYAPEKLPALGEDCAAYVASKGAAGAAAEGARYTGVQDYDDYPTENHPSKSLYYDPDEPAPDSDWANWPTYKGLMDRAQQIQIDPQGLAVPFYITNGNHDVLVQGNEDAVRAIEDIATGCFKALATTADPTKPDPPDGPDPNPLLSKTNVGTLVPPDPKRQFVDKPQIKKIYGATNEGPGDDDHGFKHVSADENRKSGGSASYYAWDPPQTPGLRFISIDTNSEGGQTAETLVEGQPSTPGSSNGNLDDPQFQWLKRELAAARARDQMVVLFGHHPVRSMNTQVRDEQAPPCSVVNDEHGHDHAHPGCDRDPRPSDDDPDTPGVGCLHNGFDSQNVTCPGGAAQHESFEELIAQFPNVVGYVPGHTHEHRLTPFKRPNNGTTWWEINTSAVVDPPNQSRLVELMDNRDGTLSFFNTVIDHAAAATAPPGCTAAANCAAAFDGEQLASIGRTFSFNDPDNDNSGLGRVQDRNAELLLEDPRPLADLSVVKSDAPDPVRVGEELTYTLAVARTGTEKAHAVTLTDELPEDVIFRDAVPTRGTCALSGRTVKCDIGTLEPGSGASVAITVEPEKEGELVNRAEVRGNVSDRDGGNDAATARTEVLPAPPDDGVPGDGGGPGPGDGDAGGGSGGGAPAGGGGAPAPSVSAKPCLPRVLRVSSTRIGPARLGGSLRALEARYRVDNRSRAGVRFCVDGGGRFLVSTRRGRIDFVASTAGGHRTRQAAPGKRPRGGRLKGARRVRSGLLVGRTGRTGRVVYGTRRGRITFLGVARRDRARALSLARRLRGLGLR